MAIPAGRRHRDLWAWAERLTPGVKPEARIEIWARGGAKSTTAELIAVRCGLTLQRRFVFYVCGTRHQADMHVQTIAALLERLDIPRAVSAYGHSRGWTAQLLRTASGFNVLAVGLDGNIRGAKLDELRPDFIILDDVDDRHDTPKATTKKLRIITQTILPAGSGDAATLFIQNKIHPNSCIAQLADGRADAMLDRQVTEEPAVWDLQVKRGTLPDGRPRYCITGGTPTWPEGQGVAVCEAQINEWGLEAFLSESQHEVGRGGLAFPTFNPVVHVIDDFDVPGDWRMWGGFDYGNNHPQAAYLLTEHDGDVFVCGEHRRRKTKARQHAEAMRELCNHLGRELDDISWYAGHDVFLKGRDVRTNESIEEIYAALGVRLRRAQNDRINRANALRERLGDPDEDIRPTLYIFRSCVHLIACLQRLQADPDRPDDVLKVDADQHGNGGDDEYDAMTYGLMEAGGGFVSGVV